MTKSFYFSSDGKIRYGEKYSHLADVTVELPEPEDREGYTVQPAYDPASKEGYWEYIKIPLSPEEQVNQLKSDLDKAVLELSVMIAMQGGNA